MGGDKGAAVALLYPSTQHDCANVRDSTRVRGSSGRFANHSQPRSDVSRRELEATSR